MKNKEVEVLIRDAKRKAKLGLLPIIRQDKDFGRTVLNSVTDLIQEYLSLKKQIKVSNKKLTLLGEMFFKLEYTPDFNRDAVINRYKKKLGF